MLEKIPQRQGQQPSEIRVSSPLRTSDSASLMKVMRKERHWPGTFLASFTSDHLSQSDLIPAALSGEPLNQIINCHNLVLVSKQ